MWKNVTSENTGYTFYNNHLDIKARFHSFVADGASTSRVNPFAVGEKGKGFALATQFLCERAEENVVNQHPHPKIPKPKISFRVGHEIGHFGWKGYEEIDVLRVTKTDLNPVDAYKVRDQRLQRQLQIDQRKCDTPSAFYV